METWDGLDNSQLDREYRKFVEHIADELAAEDEPPSEADVIEAQQRWEMFEANRDAARNRYVTVLSSRYDDLAARAIENEIAAKRAQNDLYVVGTLCVVLTILASLIMVTR